MAGASSPPRWPTCRSGATPPLVLVSALLGTKDAEGFLANFSGLARFLVAVPLAGQMAARPPEEVAEIAGRAGLTAATAPSLEAALASLGDRAWERPPRC